MKDCSVKSRKVGEIKDEIALKTKIPRELQSLWWHGYILDKDSESLMDACVGVNKGETIEPSIHELVVFSTVPIRQHRPNATAPGRRFRSGSFDFKGDNGRSSCVIL